MSSEKSHISNSTTEAPQHIGVPTQSSAERVELEITGLVQGGRGLARRGGLVWFVTGGLPGDRLQAEPISRRPSYVEARALRIERPGPHRRDPACPVQDRCGGCPWMALEDDQQRHWKRRLVCEALERIAGLDSPEVEPVRRISATLGYRNKVEFGLGRGVVGLVHRDAARGLVDVHACAVQHPDANAVLATARAFLLSGGSGALAGGPTRDLRLVIRHSRADGKILVLLREATRSFPRARELAAHLVDRHPEVSGVVRLKSQSGRRGGARIEPLAGRPWVREIVAGVEFRLPAATFFQVNAEGASALVEIVAECAGELSGRTLIDLYGGVGAYAFELLRRGAGRAVVCDADPAAIACGREAARRARINGIEHRNEAVGRFLSNPSSRSASVDLIVANPPRDGLGPEVCRRLLGVPTRRLVVVSCNPATLSRDLRVLTGGGYRIDRVVPVDLFPQTAHVEAVVALRAAGRPRPRRAGSPRPACGSG